MKSRLSSACQHLKAVARNYTRGTSRLRVLRNVTAIAAWYCLQEGALTRNIGRALGYVESLTERDVFLLCCGFGLGAISIAITAYLRRADQRSRNEDAQRIATEVVPHLLNTSESDAFVLYLRPFAADQAMRIRQQIGLTWRLFASPVSVRVDEFVQAALKLHGVPLVCLGYADLSIGAGKIETSDEAWRRTFRELANKSVGIAVVPGDRSGIVEEIHWLRAMGHFHKTTFLKPSTYSEQDWQALTEKFEEEEGLDLPKWKPQTILFQLYDSGAVRSEWTLLIHWWERASFRILGGSLEDSDKLLSRLLAPKEQ